MTTQVPATFIDGVFKPDQSPSLAEMTRVKLTIETLDETVEPAAAWTSLKARLRQRPIRSGGRRFTRDELRVRR